MNCVADLLKAGQDLRALEVLRLRTESDVLDTCSRQVLLAELLERTGEHAKAVDAASRLLRSGPTPPAASRAHVVIGNVLRDGGRTAEAIEHFQRAAALAEGAEEAGVHCWALLRLMLTLAEGPGLHAAMASLPIVRRSVWHAGDPLAVVALHLYVAQLEAKRGLLWNAREHVRIGRSILTGCENSWLQGTAAIDASCLAFLSSDLQTAREEARRARTRQNKAGMLRSESGSREPRAPRTCGWPTADG